MQKLQLVYQDRVLDDRMSLGHLPGAPPYVLQLLQSKGRSTLLGTLQIDYLDTLGSVSIWTSIEISCQSDILRPPDLNYVKHI